MYKLKITTADGNSVIIRFPRHKPYTATLAKAIEQHNLPISGDKRLVFVSNMSMQAMYNICCAVQSVFDDTLVWDVEPAKEPQGYDAHLWWSPVGSPKQP